MSDVAVPFWRSRLAVALLLLGLVVAFVPGLVCGRQFLAVVRTSTRNPYKVYAFAVDVFRDAFHPPPDPIGRWTGTSASMLISSDIEWQAVAVSLSLVPMLFVWWRRGGVGLARVAGVACAVVAGASVVALVKWMPGLNELPGGVWWTVPVGGALMATAFLVAPAPRVRDE